MTPISFNSKLTLLLVSSLTIMSVITISPALPGMSAAFSDVENADFLVKMILTIPALFIAISSPIAGRYIDRYGRLKLLIVSIILYGISGVAGFFLENIWHILISRIFLGIAVGFSMTIVVTLVGDYFEGLDRQKFIGIQIAFMSIGGIIFITGGGILADVGWKYPFLLYLFSFLVLPLVLLFLKEPDVHRNQDTVDATLKSPSFIWLLFLNTMVMWVIFFLIPVQIPFFLKEIGVEKNSLIGAAIAMSTAFSAVSSFYYSRIKGKYSFMTIFGVGYILMGLGYLCVYYSESYSLVVVAMILAGLGIGIMIPNTNMWVMKIAPPQIRGREVGKLTFFWFFGQFISPIALLPLSTNFSLATTFLIAALTLLLFGVTSYLLHFRYGEKQ